MSKLLLLSLSTQYTVDGQYIPSLFIEPEVRHDKTSYNNVNSVILTQFSCDLLYVFILVQSFTLFVGKIALMANVLICYN